MTRIHHIRVPHESFEGIRDQRVCFDVRPWDRDFRRGDVVVYLDEAPSQWWAARVVGQVLGPGSHPGLADGYGAFAITTDNLLPKLRVAGGPATVNNVGLPPKETVPPAERGAA